MAAAKTFYELDGKRWLRVARAARLIGTSAAKIRAMMGDGSLDWRQLRSGSTTFLVEEATVLRLRADRGQGVKEARARISPRREPKTAVVRSYKYTPPVGPAPRGPGVFDRTWDPSPGAEGLARGRGKGDGVG